MTPSGMIQQYKKIFSKRLIDPFQDEVAARDEPADLHELVLLATRWTILTESGERSLPIPLPLLQTVHRSSLLPAHSTVYQS